MTEQESQLLKDIYDSDDHCKSFRPVSEFLLLVEKLKKAGMVNFTIPIKGIESKIETVQLTPKGKFYVEDKEKALLNLYRYESGNPDSFKAVADCFVGLNSRFDELVKLLENEGLIIPANEWKYEDGKEVFSSRHVLTEKGYLYLKNYNLI